MRIKKSQLRRLIREALLREQTEDSITVNALFKWDDYNYSGEPSESPEQVTLSKDELLESGDDWWSGALTSWASMNLDGGLEVSDVEVSPEDEVRLTNWIDAQLAGSDEGDDSKPPAGGYNYLAAGQSADEAFEQLRPHPYSRGAVPPTEIAKELEDLGFPKRDGGETLVDVVARLM
jgi:hypothetical protein